MCILKLPRVSLILFNTWLIGGIIFFLFTVYSDFFLIGRANRKLKRSANFPCILCTRAYRKTHTNTPSHKCVHPSILPVSVTALSLSLSSSLSLINSFSPAFQPVISCFFCALQNGGWAESSGWKWVPVHRTARAAEVPELPAGSGGGDGLVREQSRGNRTLRPAGEAAVLWQMLSIQCVFWLQIAEKLFKNLSL